MLVIAGERALSTRELVDTVCRTLGVPPPWLHLPYAMGAAAAAAAEAIFKTVDRDPPISRRTLEFFTVNNAFDTTAARNVLGFTPAYSLEQGLQVMRETVDAASLQRVA